ncbi:hypothetical protein Hbl1158_10340 [Halobaculum sp. CBA1158]|uniref:hypothetical protein n=1 Tax=Halobaculum sp. CBA1158 TaxID=2904243 RepID=UPI001F3E44A8|nr:hypothetical protein [Halobaculum sp. CBA1158]UIO98933.1 hypothetical protein Hbl1158_10340 [Halobaculum sp. CBA1158]
MPEYRDEQPHLFDTRPPDHRCGSTLPADGEREGICTVCHARVTVGPDGEEFGHGYRCPHRPDKFSIRGDKENRISEHICPECGRGNFETRKQMRCHHASVHGEALRETRSCDYCEAEFEPNRSRKHPQQYCSPACAQQARRDRVTIECDTCGEAFETVPSERERGKRYCSEACKIEGIRSDVTKTCEECGDEYEVKAWNAAGSRFCSKSCLGRANALSTFHRDESAGGVAGD